MRLCVCVFVCLCVLADGDEFLGVREQRFRTQLGETVLTSGHTARNRFSARSRSGFVSLLGDRATNANTRVGTRLVPSLVHKKAFGVWSRAPNDDSGVQ